MRMMLERMDEFFTARTEGYDEHMLRDVEGCREGYAEMARLVPAGTKELLDLGCGTGLELDFLFERFPALRVTGIDLTPAMLDCLRKKHPDKAMTLICGDYFQVDFGTECFDAAVSFETMHHFAPEKKRELYRRVWQSLRPGGCYIECDYMAETQEQEDFFFAENERLRREAGAKEGEYFHYDTPCTEENQIRLLRDAGFAQVEKIWRIGGTVMLAAWR